MFKKMRRKEKKLSAQESIHVLESADEGVLATIGEDNYPYAVPLNYVYHDSSIYFHCATSGHKINNIDHNAKVSFCVMQGTEIIPEEFSTKFKSVIIFGTAKEVLEEEKERGLLALVHRFSGEYLEAGEKYIKNAIDKTKVFKITIEHLSGKGTK